jgi:hypothetical protein
MRAIGSRFSSRPRPTASRAAATTRSASQSEILKLVGIA